MYSWKDNVFVRVALVVLIVCCIGTSLSMQVKYNQLLETRDALAEQITAYEDRVSDLQDELSVPFDDEYVIRFAREKLNYRLPEEIVFYNDLTH